MPWRSIDPDVLVRFLHETSAATWSAGSDGYVVDATEWMALTGQTAEEAAGDGWMQAVHPDDLDRVRSAWENALSHTSHYNTDYRIRCEDGQYRWFNVRGTPVMDGHGNAEKWVGVILAIPGQARPSRAPYATAASRTVNQFDDITPAALRAARAMLGWSAEELATAAGIARSTLRRLEDDQPSVPHRGSVAKVLGVLARQGIEGIGDQGMIRGVTMGAAAEG